MGVRGGSVARIRQWSTLSTLERQPGPLTPEWPPRAVASRGGTLKPTGAGRRELTIQSQLVVEPIGWVESTLVEPAEAPRQGDEGAPDAWLVLLPAVRDGLRGLEVGTDVLILTWLDRASREVLSVHPRGETERPMTGVFNTRSPDRPNPIGLHRVTILAIDGNRVHVRNLEAVDQTPVLDVKPVLGAIGER